MAVKRITCSKCGAILSPEKYYKSKAEKNEYYGKLQICKNCLQEIYNKLFSKSMDRKETIIEFCSLVDVPFSESIYDMSVNAFATRGEADEYKLATTYLSFINSGVGKNAGSTFGDSENFNRLFNEGGGFDSNTQFKLDRAQEEIINLTEHIKDLELENSSLSKENSVLKPENVKLQSRLIASETAAATLKISNEQEVARKEGLKIQLESEITRLSSELNITKLNLSDTNKKLKEKTDECNLLQKTVNSYNKQSLVLENDATDATRNLEKYKEKKDKELEELTVKYEEDTKKLKAEVQKLSIELEDQKNIGNGIYLDKESGEEIPEDYIFEWGEGFDLKDYEFLDKRANIWRDRHEITKESEEVLLRHIVILELKIRKKDATGDDTSDDLKLLQNLMKTANFVQRVGVNSQKSNSKDSFGEWIKDIEDNSPAEWFDNQKKFKDIDGLQGYIKKYIIRPLKNFVTGSRDFDSILDNMPDGDINE